MKKYTIKEMQAHAETKRGNCLSTTYVNNHTKLRWQCELKHEWEADAEHVLRRGTWCPECANGLNERICRKLFEAIFSKKFPTKKPTWLVNSRGNRMELDGYYKELKLGFEYHGSQHYEPSWRGQSLKQRKKDDERKAELCEQHGIILIEVPFRVKPEKMAAYILKKCKFLGFAVPKLDKLPDYKQLDAYSPHILREYQKLAKSRNGKCLSDRYIDSETKMKWGCNICGHTWKAIPDSIKQGTWCPKCGKRNAARKRLLGIGYFRELVEKRGGKLLSTKYLGYTGLGTHLSVQWACGHKVDVSPRQITRGSACKICATTENRKGGRQKGVCKVDGCTKPHYAKGYCLMHYKRVKKRGTTEPRKPFNEKEYQREYRKQHKEYFREYHKEYNKDYKKKNKDKIRVQSRDYKRRKRAEKKASLVWVSAPNQ